MGACQRFPQSRVRFSLLSEIKNLFRIGTVSAFFCALPSVPKESVAIDAWPTVRVDLTVNENPGQRLDKIVSC